MSKVIFITDRYSKEIAIKKIIIPLIDKLIFKNLPSEFSDNAFRAYTNMAVRKAKEKATLELTLNLLHENIHRINVIDEIFLKKEKVIFVNVVVMTSDEARKYESSKYDEFIYLEGDPVAVYGKVREVLNGLARNMYYGMAMEAFICTQLKKNEKNTFLGITLDQVFLSTHSQDIHQKIDGQCSYHTAAYRGVFHFGIKSSIEGIESEKKPNVPQLAAGNFNIHYIEIGQAICKMIQSYDEGKVLHCFLNGGAYYIEGPKITRD